MQTSDLQKIRFQELHKQLCEYESLYNFPSNLSLEDKSKYEACLYEWLDLEKIVG